MFNDRWVPLRFVVANTLGLILVLAVNALANILPINGFNTGEISDMYPNLFTPSGVTFSIWGVIYIFLILFVLYNQPWIGKKSDKKIVENIRWYFLLSCLLNGGWIVLWHYLYIEWSFVVMVALLLVLLRIFYIVHRNIYSDPNNQLFVQIPFSIYTGWITVATIANATALLVHVQWNGFGWDQSLWTLVMMIVATALMGTVVWRFRDGVYGLVLIWTLAGIGWKHVDVYAWAYPQVVIGAVACGIMMVVIIGVVALNERKKAKRWF